MAYARWMSIGGRVVSPINIDAGRSHTISGHLALAPGFGTFYVLSCCVVPTWLAAPGHAVMPRMVDDFARAHGPLVELQGIAVVVGRACNALGPPRMKQGISSFCATTPVTFRARP